MLKYNLYIYGGRNGTWWNKHKKVYMSIRNETKNNMVVQVGDLTIINEFNPSHTDNFTVEANIIDNKLTISITENGDGKEIRCGDRERSTPTAGVSLYRTSELAATGG